MPPRARILAALPASDLPLYAEVRARLIEGMSALAWQPGEAIPSESELARAFGVAVGTVRKAVDTLVAERALIRRQGKGTFVATHDGRRLMFHFFHIVERGGARAYPQVRLLDFRRERADAASAAALAIAPAEKVIRIRNLLSLGGRPAIVDDITIPADADTDALLARALVRAIAYSKLGDAGFYQVAATNDPEVSAAVSAFADANKILRTAGAP